MNERFFYLSYSAIHIAQLMLPDTHNCPSICFEPRLLCPVPLDVLPEFWVPVGLVALWQAQVLRATMPKAAIDENGELLCGEGYVDVLIPIMRPIPDPPSPKSFSKGKFGFGVLALDGGHYFRAHFLCDLIHA